MTRIGLTALVLATAPACIVYTHDDHVPPAEVLIVEDWVNVPPEVLSAEAGVYWEPMSLDDVWYFEAVVDDGNGPYDVVAVYADVYDEYRGGVMVESFPLYPTNDPFLWTSDWVGSSTFLDPFHGGYTVDFVAYDAVDDWGVQTVWATTYTW